MTVQDLLNEDIKTVQPQIIVRQVYEYVRQNAVDARSRANTFGPRKSLGEFYDLVRQAIRNREERAGTPKENQLIFTEEEPDEKSQTESIVFSLIERTPGQFAQGKPNSQDHVNLRPMIREEYDDVDFPGYRKIKYGYYYDQTVRFTCWARTNKVANTRADWFEDLMEEYSWWFKVQGMDRVIYWRRGTDLVTTVNDNKWYGRPIDFFVRTEKIRVFREKALEEVLISLSVQE